MFRVAQILAILSAAVAFSPTAVNRYAKSSLAMAFEKEVGVQPPLGYWDPLGLLKDGDQAKFDRLRLVETKHGRIAMLAVLGHIVTAKGDRLPGNIAYGLPFADVKPGLGALDTIPESGIVQIIAFIGAIEFGYYNIAEPLEKWCMSDENTFFKWDEATRKKKLAIELNNGRAAQMGILGLMVHEKLNGEPYVINSLLGMPVPGFK